jgi:hypothetical protein
MIELAFVVDFLEHQYSGVAHLSEEEFPFLSVDEHGLTTGYVCSHRTKKHLLGIEIRDLAPDVPQLHESLPT